MVRLFGETVERVRRKVRTGGDNQPVETDRRVGGLDPPVVDVDLVDLGLADLHHSPAQPCQLGADLLRRASPGQHPQERRCELVGRRPVDDHDPVGRGQEATQSAGRYQAPGAPAEDDDGVVNHGSSFRPPQIGFGDPVACDSGRPE